MRSHVQRLLAAQRDQLSPQAIGAITLAMNQLRDAIAAGENIGKIRIKMDELDFAANKWLKPYPNAAVARKCGSHSRGGGGGHGHPHVFRAAIQNPDRFDAADAVRRHLQKLSAARWPARRPELQNSDRWERIKEWFEGISYIHVVANTDGELQAVEPPVRFLIFNIKQTLWIGGQSQTIWFPPDYGEQNLQMRAGLRTRAEFGEGQRCQKGQDVVKIQIAAGDHLFVDRLSYNFRKPQRGDIIVFATAGVPEDRRAAVGMPGDQFYIKRLVGLGGETLALAQDYEVAGAPQFGGETVPVGHLVVNGQPLSASTPHFENLYSFSGVPPGTKTFITRITSITVMR